MSGSIDLFAEQVWPLDEFAVLFGLPDGRTFTEDDLRRWATTGSQGVVLDSISFRDGQGLPKVARTSREALARFIAAHEGKPLRLGSARRAAPDGGGRAAGVGGVE